MMPNRHKLALLTMLGAYPTIVTLLLVLDPVMGDAPMPLKAAVLVPLMVVTLTYGVMPLLTQRFANWIQTPVTGRGASLTALAIAALSTSVALTEEPATNNGRASTVSALDGMTVDHIMINVSDFEESIEWYTEKLGFQETVRWTVDGLPGTDLAYLKLGDFLLEIASSPTSDATVRLPRATDFNSHFAQRGMTHLCFKVRDVDAALAELNTNGVPTFSSAIDFPALNTRVGFIQDPDGNVIELKGPMAGKNVVDGVATWANLEASSEQ